MITDHTSQHVGFSLEALISNCYCKKNPKDNNALVRLDSNTTEECPDTKIAADQWKTKM